MFGYNVLLTSIVLTTAFVQSLKSSDTFVLLHVLFRHGDRTTDDASTLYLTDPHKDHDYYPYGKGELTNIGKRTEYSIGKALRKKYGKFLGRTYTPDVLYARSTAYNRAKTSLQLVLASLFPPRYSQIWNILLFNWQPIPYNYVPLHEDSLLFPSATPPFAKYYAEYLETPEYEILKAKYQDLFDYVSENIGSNFTTFKDLFIIYDTLKTHAENGFHIPEWAKSVYPYTLKEAANHAYEILVATKDLKRTITGCLLSKITSDTLNKINGSEYLKNTKVFLYSAHDINIVTLLITLGLYDYSYGTPPYGSYVVFEVHQLDASYGFQISFQNYTQAEPLLLKLPNCSNPCPIDDFIKLTKEYYPKEEECN